MTLRWSNYLNRLFKQESRLLVVHDGLRQVAADLVVLTSQLVKIFYYWTVAASRTESVSID